MSDKLVLVEDEALQEDRIVTVLRSVLPQITVVIIRTESEFRGAFEEFILDPPLAFVFDVTLKWANPGEVSRPIPPEFRDKADQAGLRCAQLVAENQNFSSVPIILYTIFEEMDLDDEYLNLKKRVHYVRKSRDIHDLGRRLSRLLS